MTFPIWGPQDILDDEFVGEYLVQSKQKAKPAAKKGTARKPAAKMVKRAKPH